jgi:hypothetical protein
MRGAGLADVPKEGGAADRADEDPAIHARIDTFRDLFKEQQEPLLAERGLMGLLEKEDLAAKPWARYRIETRCDRRAFCQAARSPWDRRSGEGQGQAKCS